LTFPIKKRINIELFIAGKEGLYIHSMANFLAKLKRVNCFGGKTKAEMRTQNGSLFGMTCLKDLGMTN